MTVREGDEIPGRVVTASAEKMKTLSALTRDSNPLHFDQDAVERAGLGRRTVNQGGTNLAYVIDSVRAWAGASVEIRSVQATYTSNVFAGDTVVAGGRVTGVSTAQAGRFVVECDVWLDVQGGSRALQGQITIALDR
jgi:acyl dehydratase